VRNRRHFGRRNAEDGDEAGVSVHSLRNGPQYDIDEDEDEDDLNLNLSEELVGWNQCCCWWCQWPLAEVREIGIEHMDELRGSILHISRRTCARISAAHIRRWYSSRVASLQLESASRTFALSEQTSVVPVFEA